MAYPPSRKNRGYIVILFALIAAVGVAVWSMQDTLNDGTGQTGVPVQGGQTVGGLVSGLPPDSGDAPGAPDPTGQTETADPAGGANGAVPDGLPAGLPGDTPAGTPADTPSATSGAGPAATQPVTPQDPGMAQNGSPGQDGAPVVAPRPGNAPVAVPAPRIQTPEEAFASPELDGVSPGPGAETGTEAGTENGLEGADAAGSGTAPVSGAAQGSSLFFFDDAARFLVGNYWPRGTHPAATAGGISTAGLKTANMRYGTDAPGIRLDGQTPMRGAAALSRFFTPAMLDSLYAAHADEFVTAMHNAAAARRIGQGQDRRPLTAAERAEMFAIYADRARGLAATLDAYADDPGVRTLVEDLDYAEDAVHAANQDYLESSAAYAGAVEENLPERDDAKALMEQDALTYQERILAREEARSALAAALGAVLDEDTRIYAAAWAYRRGQNSAPALRGAADLLQKLAGRLDAAAQ